MDKSINNKTRCKTCRKCLCIECYDRVSKFLNVLNEKVEVEYKCPFCNVVETKNLEELSSDILIRFTETAVLNFVEQLKKIEELQEDYDDLIRRIQFYEKNDLKEKREAYKYRQLKEEIQILKKAGRKTIKFSEIEKMI